MSSTIDFQENQKSSTSIIRRMVITPQSNEKANIVIQGTMENDRKMVVSTVTTNEEWKEWKKDFDKKDKVNKASPIAGKAIELTKVYDEFTAIANFDFKVIIIGQ